MGQSVNSAALSEELVPNHEGKSSHTGIGEIHDNFGPDFVHGERTFSALLTRYELYASNRSDDAFNYAKSKDEEAVVQLEEIRSGKVRAKSDAFLPVTHVIDNAMAHFRQLLNRRDPHCTGYKPFLTLQWLEAFDARLATNKHRPSSDGERISHSVIGSIKSLKNRGLGFITAKGTRAFKGEIVLVLASGQEAASEITHFRSFHGFEKVFISLYLNGERMGWLHNELLHRPKAKLGIDFLLPSYQHVGSPDPKDQNIFYIKRHTSTSINGVSFIVSDGDSWNKSAMNVDATTR